MIQIKNHEGVLEAPLTKNDIFPIKFKMNKMYFLLKLKKNNGWETSQIFLRK